MARQSFPNTIFQEMRDEMRAIRAEVQELKVEFAAYKGAMKVFNWIAFTMLPALGSALAYFGMKLGLVQTH